MKKCPFCGADIEDSARFCLFCMQSLTDKEQILLSKKKKPQWPMAVAAIVALAVLMMFLLLKMLDRDAESHPTQPPHTGASTSAQTEAGVSPTENEPVGTELPEIDIETETTTPSDPDPKPEQTIPPHVHDYCVKNTAVAYQKEAATCLAAAVYYYACECGDKGTETFSYGELGEHNIVEIPGYPADCTTPGLSNKKECSVCQMIFFPHQLIKETGHTFELGEGNNGCLICGEMGTVVIQVPTFPFIQNDIFRVNGGTYVIRPADKEWEISLRISYTNISSDSVLLNPNNAVFMVGEGYAMSIDCIAITLRPDETGIYQATFRVPASEDTLILMFR